MPITADDIKALRQAKLKKCFLEPTISLGSFKLESQ